MAEQMLPQSDRAGPPAVSHPTHAMTAPGQNYAFLVHSAETLPNNLPPNVDYPALPRQKRRRTSPEDQATLEAEYLRNPKPDKAARIEIVRRVALGEKEVQIWFQNRRQSSRRKSRPLSLHEIAHYQSLSTSPGFDTISRSISHNASLHSSADSSKPDAPSPPFTARKEGSPGLVHEGHDMDLAAVEVPSSQPVPSSQDSSSALMKYLANRGSAAPAPPPRSSHGDKPEEVEPSSQVTVEHDLETPAKRQRTSSSFVRLSMTSDGNAKVVTHDESSPSPPRATPSGPPQSSATFSVQGLDDSAQLASSQGSSALRRKASGRSRDSRAWEFWCDKDARSELEEKADQENSGSAADAIGLLRSNSGRAILRSLSGKRSVQSTELTSVKRVKTFKTPLLQQSPAKHNKQSPKRTPGTKGAYITPARLRKGTSGLGIELPATDSDKENWSPERQIQSTPFVRPTTIQSERHHRVRNQASSPLKAGRRFKKPSSESTELVDASGEDDEVAGFTDRDRKSTSVSEEEELDCVQGLLSLSQGNWR